MLEQDKDFEQYIKSIEINPQFLIKINNNIYLNENEINILKRYNINYESCHDFNELLYRIDEILETDSCFEDLDEISQNISERNYYLYTKK